MTLRNTPNNSIKQTSRDNWKAISQETRRAFDKQSMDTLIDFYNQDEIIEVRTFLQEFEARTDSQQEEILMQLPEYHFFVQSMSSVAKTLSKNFIKTLKHKNKKNKYYKYAHTQSIELAFSRTMPILWNEVFLPLLSTSKKFLKECLLLSQNPKRVFWNFCNF